MNLLILIVVFLGLVQFGASLFFETAIVGSALVGYIFRCKFYECCDKDYVPLNTSKLKEDLDSKLYGQHIAKDIIFSSIKSHVLHENPKKPLVLSLHGLPGSGKNYVSTMIANALFKHGEKSTHYHFFNGRNDFPSEKFTDLYKANLKRDIELALDKCERSLFVFDEVDKMPPGVLDVLVPFIDYTNWRSRSKNKAIFIFLSNTGSKLIVNEMINLWETGRSREDASIRDFEPLVAIGAFNEKGGLQKSGTIESKLIDHYIPFMPLEEKHVIECIKDAFKHYGSSNPTSDMIKDVLKHVTYGPPPHNLYSTGGCKRLDSKVTSILRRWEFDSEL